MKMARMAAKKANQSVRSHQQMKGKYHCVLLFVASDKSEKEVAKENIRTENYPCCNETTEVAASDGKAFCISCVNVGMDTTTIRKAVVGIMEPKLCVDEPAPGLKTILSFKLPDQRSGKIIGILLNDNSPTIVGATIAF
ncbi:Voltage-dependent anion-selective channel protein 1 [Sarracenia purpurea var. burkii]